MPKIPADRVDKRLPETDASGWSAAYDVYLGLATVSDSMIQQDENWLLEPLEDPAGATVPYFFLVRFGTMRVPMLVVDGEFIGQNGGEEPACTYLRALGFPSSRLSRQLLGEVLRHYGVLAYPWYPTAHTWEQLDAHYTDQELPIPELSYDGESARLVIEAVVREADSHGGAPSVTRRRRVLTFDESANLDVQELVHTADGWV